MFGMKDSFPFSFCSFASFSFSFSLTLRLNVKSENRSRMPTNSDAFINWWTSYPFGESTPDVGGFELSKSIVPSIFSLNSSFSLTSIAVKVLLRSDMFILSKAITNCFAFSVSIVPFTGFKSAKAVSTRHRYIWEAVNSRPRLGLNLLSKIKSYYSDFKNKNALRIISKLARLM